MRYAEKIGRNVNAFVTALLFVLFIGLDAFSQTVVRPIGSGTSSDPFQIDSLDNLYWITQNSSTWDSCFAQTGDIDASSDTSWDSGKGFSPIGHEFSYFSGTYDGRGHSITGLFMSRSDTDYIGMFGGAIDATVKNVRLINEEISGRNYVGGLIGSSFSSTIDSCSTSGSVTGTGNQIGGLVGSYSVDAYYTVTATSYCYSTANVTGTGGSSTQEVGGLAGATNQCNFYYCYSTGNAVDSLGRFVGGLCGETNQTSISNCYSRGNVYGDSYVGGLLGYYRGVATRCYSTGRVAAGTSTYVGGLMGYTGGAAVYYSFWDTVSSGQSNAYTGGTPAATLAMKTESTFTSAGWDFTNTWAIDTSINNGYPGLLWQSEYVPASPADTTYASTNVSWGSARLNGTVLPYKSTTTVKFIYGTVSGNYPDTAVASQSPLNGWSGSAVSANISELNSSTTYYYRVIASNSHGSTEGSELSFTTTAFVAVQPAGGGTSSSDPYHVDSLQNLYWITQNSNSWDSYFVQDTDIDASTSIYWNSGAGFSPIGNSSTFTGTYDGKGHTITGIFISASSSDEVGMFASAASDTIENLRLVNEHVVGGSEVGGLVGLCTASLIDSCSTSGSVTGGSGGYVGGLIGYNDSSSINGCFSADTVNDPSGQAVGGLAGTSLLGSTFTNCYATGNVTASSEAGGLIGYNTPRSSISECYATGNVSISGSGESAGGLVGYNYIDCPVSKSYSTGTVTGGQYDTGGLIGYNSSNCSITNCYSTGSASGSWEVGGLIGYNYSSVNYSYSIGYVTGTNYVGGLIGFNTSSTVTGGLWDMGTSGQSASAAGTAESDSAMKVEATFTDAVWDFTSTWAINSGTNNGYPYLINVTDHSLPVQATDFVVTANAGSVTLTWKTQSEVNNAGFNVLREDPNSFVFKLISSYTSNDSLRGLGTSSTGNTYSFIDTKVISGKSYDYKIQSVSTNGTTKDLSTLSVTVDVPKTYALYQNYPNPFNPTTVISYQLSAVSRVTLKVYDVLGREVATLVDSRQNAGVYKVSFDGTKYASGVYFYRISAVGNDGQKFVSIKKLVLMK